MNDTALTTLERAESSRLICARNRELTAKPAAARPWAPFGCCPGASDDDITDRRLLRFFETQSVKPSPSRKFSRSTRLLGSVRRLVNSRKVREPAAGGAAAAGDGVELLESRGGLVIERST